MTMEGKAINICCSKEYLPYTSKIEYRSTANGVLNGNIDFRGKRFEQIAFSLVEKRGDSCHDIMLFHPDLVDGQDIPGRTACSGAGGNGKRRNPLHW
jgi:hypothetical protein